MYCWQCGFWGILGAFGEGAGAGFLGTEGLRFLPGARGSFASCEALETRPAYIPE